MRERGRTGRAPSAPVRGRPDAHRFDRKGMLMARILEALNQTDLRGRPSAAPASNPDPPGVDAGNGAAVPIAGEVPFIEVGGSQIEASADVLAARRVAPARMPARVKA